MISKPKAKYKSICCSAIQRCTNFSRCFGCYRRKAGPLVYGNSGAGKYGDRISPWLLLPYSITGTVDPASPGRSMTRPMFASTTLTSPLLSPQKWQCSVRKPVWSHSFIMCVYEWQTICQYAQYCCLGKLQVTLKAFFSGRIHGESWGSDGETDTWKLSRR